MNKKTIIAVLTVIVIVLAVIFGEKCYFYRNNFVADTSFCLNTVIEQKWYGKNAQKTVDEINSALAEFEGRMSPYIETSEISLINSLSGEKSAEITEKTFKTLKIAKEMSIVSNGSFDITIFPLVQLWGITTDNPKVPSQEEINNALNLLSINELILEEKGGKYYAFLERKGMAIDLGGIAKGMAADLVGEIARKNNVNGYASLGGNLSVWGKKPDGSDFKFGLRNPRGAQNQYIGILTLDGKTMSTTGDYERFFEENGKVYHHILDTKTGYPVENDLISVTVISSNGALADCLSTQIFVDGKKNLNKYLNNAEYDIIAVDSDYKIYMSDSIKDEFSFQDDSKMFSIVAD